MSHGVGVVVVPKVTENGMQAEWSREEPGKMAFLAAAADFEGDVASFSSTKVREALKERTSDAVSNYLSPSAAQFMLQPTDAERAAFAADFKKLLTE